jgi:hypothetical protein
MQRSDHPRILQLELSVIRNEPLTTTAQPPLPPPAIAALHKGNKIEGIKIVRQELDIGLKEAKDAVERYLASQPTLQSAFAAQQSEVKRRVLIWLAAIIGLAIVTCRWFSS